MTSSHALDRPVWNALTTVQKGFAEGNDWARRYPVPVGPFAATIDDSQRSFEALAALLRPADRVALFTLERPSLHDGLKVVFEKPVEQMVWSRLDFAMPPDVVPLSDDDVPAMAALVDLTKPGPFGPRSHELGKFYGIKEAGTLVAMAGERMKLPGHTEITVVCVHPAFRGRGLAEKVMLAVACEIVAAGQRPFLHVFTDNVRALARYHQLGLSLRRRFQATGVVLRA
jgi:predicted GNAT family acetyltransferase